MTLPMTRSGNPAVTVAANFDSVLVPDDHVSRSKNDNYYLNAGNVLRVRAVTVL